MRKKVLLIMQRKILSDALIVQTANDTRFELSAEKNYATAALTAEACSPDIAVVEIPESGPWKLAEKCLAICDVIRKQLPHCKQVILCSENDKDSCRTAIQAKQERRIDDFLFYDNSVNYLLSKLEALV
jgi:DNA-binding NarL/FixJ family response regulator